MSSKVITPGLPYSGGTLSGNSSSPVLALQEEAGGTGHIQDWDNNGGTVLSYVDSSGNLVLRQDASTMQRGTLWLQPNVSSISYAALVLASASQYTVLGVDGGGGTWIGGAPYIWLGDPNNLASCGVVQCSFGYGGIPLMGLQTPTGSSFDAQVSLGVAQNSSTQTGDAIQVTNSAATVIMSVSSAGRVHGAGFQQGASGPTWTSGTGAPSGAPAGGNGSMFSRTDGAAGSTLYVWNGTAWTAVA